MKQSRLQKFSFDTERRLVQDPTSGINDFLDQSEEEMSLSKGGIKQLCELVYGVENLRKRGKDVTEEEVFED